MKTKKINCMIQPLDTNSLSVEKHEKQGIFNFDFSEVDLHISPTRANKTGYQLLEELKDRLLLNANILDFLLRNPEQIPQEWKEKMINDGRVICFFGTIYRGKGRLKEQQFIRFLFAQRHWWDDPSKITYHGGQFSLENEWRKRESIACISVAEAVLFQPLPICSTKSAEL